MIQGGPHGRSSTTTHDYIMLDLYYPKPPLQTSVPQCIRHIYIIISAEYLECASGKHLCIIALINVYFHYDVSVGKCSAEVVPPTLTQDTY